MSTVPKLSFGSFTDGGRGSFRAQEAQLRCQVRASGMQLTNQSFASRLSGSRYRPSTDTTIRPIHVDVSNEGRVPLGRLFLPRAESPAPCAPGEFPQQPPLLPLNPFVSRSVVDEVASSEASTAPDSESIVASTVSMPPLCSDDTPVVPLDVLSHCREPLPWQGHPSAPVVLSLLNARGVFLPAHKDMVAYHMAPGFLHALQHLQLGSYFIKYGVRRSAPKERFFSIRMIENSVGHTVPFLCWTVHQHAMQLVDKVPLTQLVGITKGPGEVAFQRYMVTGSVIRGCRQGPHHAKLPTHGAFTLWFFDQKHQLAQSLSLLTCSTSVFEMWSSSMQGVLAVNSVTMSEIVTPGHVSLRGPGRRSPPRQIDNLLMKAQTQVRSQYLDSDDSDADVDNLLGDDD